MFQPYKDVRKLKWQRIKGNNHDMSLSSIKEEKESKDYTYNDKNTPDKSNHVISSTPHKQDKLSDQISNDGYSVFHDEEEKKLDVTDDESKNQQSKKKQKTDLRIKIDPTKDQEFDHYKIEKIDHKKKNEDDNLNEQQMIDIAEQALARISQEMLRKNITLTELFKDSIQNINYNGQRIDVVDSEDFVKCLKILNISDFKDVEIKCLLRVLSKQHLDKSIQISDLKEILENFGVKEFDSQTQQFESNDGISENEDMKRRKKKTLNYDALSKQSLNILANFTDFLLDTDTSVYEFFDGFIYNQVVRTKNKQSTVEIMQANEFFNKIKNEEGFLEKINLDSFNEEIETNI